MRVTRLQGEHLAVCMQLSVNGPHIKDFPFQRTIEVFHKQYKRAKAIGCFKKLLPTCPFVQETREYVEANNTLPYLFR